MVIPKRQRKATTKVSLEEGTGQGLEHGKHYMKEASEANTVISVIL